VLHGKSVVRSAAVSCEIARFRARVAPQCNELPLINVFGNEDSCALADMRRVRMRRKSVAGYEREYGKRCASES